MRRGRLGKTNALAALLSRADDPGVMGQFAQAALSPQGAAVVSHERIANAKMAQDQERLNSIVTQMIALQGIDPAYKPVVDELRKEQARKTLAGKAGVAAGEPEETIFGTQPTSDVATQLDPIYERTKEDPVQFLLQIPNEVVARDPKAFEAYVAAKYGPLALAKALDSSPSFFTLMEPRKLNEISQLIGRAPQSNATLNPFVNPNATTGDWWRDWFN
jgi:hypothetical protein